MFGNGWCPGRGIHAKAEHKFHIIVVVEEMACGNRDKISHNRTHFIVVKPDFILYGADRLKRSVVDCSPKTCDAGFRPVFITNDLLNVILLMGMSALLLLMATLFIWTIIALLRCIGGLL